MFKNILLPVDLNDESSWSTALPVVISQVQAFGATLTLLAVVPDFGMNVVGSYFPADYEKQATAAAAAQLKALAADQVPKDVASATAVAYGTVYEEIIAAAGKAGCDLIVMASHRPELEDYLLGPNAARVARHAKCSVLIVRK
jgi:nucleotide-binding universal stress UspA family protein